MPNSAVPGDDGTKPATEIEKRLIVRAKQQNSRRVFLDPSQPTVRSITRVVVVTLVLLFFAERVETIVGSITALAFLVFLSVFFAYLMDPLVRLFGCHLSAPHPKDLCLAGRPSSAPM